MVTFMKRIRKCVLLQPTRNRNHPFTDHMTVQMHRIRLRDAFIISCTANISLQCPIDTGCCVTTSLHNLTAAVARAPRWLLQCTFYWTRLASCRVIFQNAKHSSKWKARTDQMQKCTKAGFLMLATAEEERARK